MNSCPKDLPILICLILAVMFLVSEEGLSSYIAFFFRCSYIQVTIRVCPGRAIADASVWLGIVSILSRFEISKAVDEKGREIVPEVEYTPGLIWYGCLNVIASSFYSHNSSVTPNPFHVALSLGLYKGSWVMGLFESELSFPLPVRLSMWPIVPIFGT